MKHNLIRVGKLKGTLQRRKDRPTTNWYLIHRINGKQKRVATNTSDLALARRKAEEHFIELERETQEGLKIDELKELWKKNNKHKSKLYIKDIDKHFNKFNGYFHNCSVDLLDKHEILKYKLYLDKQKSQRDGKLLSSTYKRNNIKTIQAVWRWGMKYDYIKQDVFFNLELPKAKQRMEYLSLSELRHLLFENRNYKLEKAYTEFLVITGWRIGELYNLKWENVKDDRILMYDTKTGDYSIKLRPKVKKVLNKIKYIVNKLNKYVVTNYDGNRISYDMLSRKYIKGCLDRAGYTNITPHHLRHSFCTNLSIKGVPIHDIQKLARHKSILTTMKYEHKTDFHIKDENVKFQEIYDLFGMEDILE